MQTIQTNNIQYAINNNFEDALAQFLSVEAEVIESLNQIERKALDGKSLSNAQDFLRQLCVRGFFIDDIAKQTEICLHDLQGLLCLQRRDLSDADFSSLLFFYCAVQCGYVSPASIALATNGIH